MQKRHTDRKLYFTELAGTAREFYVDYVARVMAVGGGTRVLEIGCGEGGNLLPFAEAGCKVVGIDIDAKRIDNARSFFAEAGVEGEFIASDFLKVPLPKDEAEAFDLVLVHDVIEHIPPESKLPFMQLMQCFMKPQAVAFFGFPAWQMPFGGHQQICHSRLSKLPYIHLLPARVYGWLLRRCGEPQNVVDEMLSIKQCRLPVERFQRLATEAGMEVKKRTLWVINPHYKQKFHLLPLREVWPFNALPWLRNFYTTSAWYLLTKKQSE
ncbi:MAG: methyltransferase domain-containing protein [Bacteroidales bacterium]|nr:methyltransferase domain-containing protein [Bacteroidales bacterium]